MSSSKKKSNNGAKAAANGANQDKDILVVTYRNHHNTFKADDPNVTIVNKTFKNMTPLVRLLQFTYSMIMVHYFLWIFPMFGSLYFFYVIGAWPISVLLLAIYIPTFINGDQYKKGRPWHGFRMSSLWDLTLNYCGVEVVRTQPLDPTKKYIFGLYPHGILILSRLAMYGGIWERLFPGIETRVLGASPMFWSPGSREICLWMGAVDAAKKVAVNCLKKYNLNLMVYPGGSDEIFETDPNSPKTTLILRKGFIKLSIQNGATIVPTFVFGEKWLYHRKYISESVKRWFMRTLRMPLIIFWGRFFSWLPYHDQEKAFLSVVFGTPIEVKQQEDPSQEYIEEIWDQYIKQIEGLYNTYKDRYGYPSDEVLVMKEAKSESRPKKTADKKKE